jgi:hypothetical protein
MNTRNKRSSAILLLIPFRFRYPTPDGTLVQEDRQHSALAYAGIAAQTPVAGGTAKYLLLMGVG